MADSKKRKHDSFADLAEQILDFVRRPGYQPLKPRVIAKKLGVNKDDAHFVRKVIKRLVKEGQLVWGNKHLVRLPQNVPAVHETAGAPPHAAATEPVTRARQTIGIFSRTAQGNGYVRLKGTLGPDERPLSVFIPAPATGDASTGDIVAVKLAKRFGPSGKLEGRILEIIERETNQFVGTYFEEAGQGYVQVDGTLFNRPVPVADPGAKGVCPNDKVVFEMIRFPTHAHDGEGVIVELLGPRGAPGVDTLSIIREFALPGTFPPDVIEDARQQARCFEETVPPGRRDLTAETVITIDPVDARDFDDAISLELLSNGHWRLGVHIADVSWFVRERSPLDREARARATSCYLPDRVIPMLPEVISNALASLQPGKVRYTKTAFLDFTPEGVRVHTELVKAAIRSKRRFTYEEVDDFLEHRAAWRGKLAPEVAALLERMHTLAMVLRDRRMQRGALELSLPEVKIDLDADGKIRGAHVVHNTVSHQIIEEFMLAANEAVAETLANAGLTFLRRVHPRPTPRKMQALTEFVRELGLADGSLRDRFLLQKVLHRVRGQPEEHAVSYAILRSLAQAVYSPVEEGHYALASDCYCHFTSPIRRYPDLTIHRLVDALIAGKPPRTDAAELAALGEHCSERERRAEAAERELTNVKLLAYLHERKGMEMDAVVTGVESYGLFARGTELPAEGLIHISSLANDVYAYDRRSHTLAGRKAGNTFRLGDLLRVQVLRVDLDRRELDFRLLRVAHRHPPDNSPQHRRQRKPAAQDTAERSKRGASRGTTKGKRPSKGKGRKRS